MCSICLNDKGGPIYQLHCGHIFHIKCIQKWYFKCHQNRSDAEIERDPFAIDLKNPCPNCRTLSCEKDWDIIINKYKNIL